MRPWAVSVALESATDSYTIGTGLDPEALQAGRERRIVRVDGKPMRGQTGLNSYLHILWLTPQMDRLFIDGASSRRRFMDRMVAIIDINHGNRLQNYEHAMRERSRLLREGSYDPQWLDVLEERMAREGVAITAARRELVSCLQGAFTMTIGAFPKPLLAFVGEMEDLLDQMSALEVEDAVQKALIQSRHKDAQRGRTSHGPHLSDLEARFATTHRLASQCSTGEQKTLLISLILAAIRVGSIHGQGVPLLLLDEVVAHLDEQYRGYLFDEINQLGVQAWMTGTDVQLFAKMATGTQYFYVENSTLKPHSVV